MNAEEREVISGIFERLKSVESEPRDPEAERLIGDLVVRQPYAPYAMAQAIYVQEQALRRANDRLEQLEAELKQARTAPQAGGFLGGLFGAGRTDQAPSRSMPSQSSSQSAAPSPWQSSAARTSVPQAGSGAAPQYGAVPPSFDPPAPQPPLGGASGAGGFLQGALAAAAGVAGGALLYQGLRGLFGGESHPGLGGFGDPANVSDSPARGFGDPENFLKTASSEDQPSDDSDSDVDGDGDNDFGGGDSDA